MKVSYLTKIGKTLEKKPLLYRVAKRMYISFKIAYIFSDARKLRDVARNRIEAHAEIKRCVSEGKTTSILISRKDTILTLDDGRKFYWHPENMNLLALPRAGEYKPEDTYLISKIINKGDIVFDIGANFGWFTTLLIDLVGETGEVHAFEPVPPVFDELKNNLELNGELQCRNLFLNNLAVSDRGGQLSIYLPVKQGPAYSSLAIHHKGKHIEYKCDTITLYEYIKTRQISKVTFIKANIEGSELLMLNGAKQILDSETPPMLLLEVAYSHTSAFGYKPKDLFMLLEKYGYKFYYMQDYNLTRLNSYDDYLPVFDSFRNFFCVIPSLHGEKLNRLKEVFGKIEVDL